MRRRRLTLANRIPGGCRALGAQTAFAGPAAPMAHYARWVTPTPPASHPHLLQATAFVLASPAAYVARALRLLGRGHPDVSKRVAARADRRRPEQLS